MKKLILLIISLALTGCATITAGTKQKVTLKASDGKNVLIRIDGQKHRLPATLDLPKKGVIIEVSEKDNPGYQHSVINFNELAGQRSITPSFWLDIIGGLFGLAGGVTSTVVDASTGSMYKYSNDTLIIPVTHQNGK